MTEEQGKSIILTDEILSIIVFIAPLFQSGAINTIMLRISSVKKKKKKKKKKNDSVLIYSTSFLSCPEPTYYPKCKEMMLTACCPASYRSDRKRPLAYPDVVYFFSQNVLNSLYNTSTLHVSHYPSHEYFTQYLQRYARIFLFICYLFNLALIVITKTRLCKYIENFTSKN